ncbi:porin family protein [Sediminibacter sp. Hel_I_10]|uniref:porin family protein n=1 Tax=Sediminibacter sp. Hel_I_10 TaxID=1392490 RepID=UPI00047E5628|nr:porin family protein [Sediminibacter sp. Hel_I_10]
MKTSIVLVTTVLFMSLMSQAQDVRFGAKAGVNFSKFGGDVIADGRTSFHIGALADIPISETFHVQPELLYSGEGSEDLNANFIRIIGVAKYYVLEGFSLEAGPQFGIRVSADEVVDANTKGFDFGLALGGGYELPDIGLLFGLRYHIGIANLASNETFDTNLGTFQVSIGYMFN